MVESAGETRDRGVGYTMGAAILAIAGALVMFTNPGNPLGGWGFALAMVAAILAVGAVHLYW